MEGLYILREKSNAENRFNAGSKAREDVDSILIEMGALPIECEFEFTDDRSSLGKLKKISYHFKTKIAWKKQLSYIPNGSTLVIQFPVRAHTVLLGSVIEELRKRSITTIAIIHDLDALRNSIYYGKNVHGLRMKLEEISAINKFDIVVAHNEKMKKALSEEFGVMKESIKSLEIFDYIISNEILDEREKLTQLKNSIVIAGNLDPDKCGYIYKLPHVADFELYGSNYKGDYADYVHHHGAFLPDMLPAELNGSYGLIWDGEETSTCSGIFGEYLRINNPHKTSLYLACGIPVIIWKEAAIAEFIVSHECGIVVQSIDEIRSVLDSITEEQYEKLRKNAEIIGEKLRRGYFTSRVINESVSYRGDK